MGNIFRKSVALLGVVLLLLSASSCKTTQANMYDAYAKAIEGEKAKNQEDGDLPGNTKQMGHSTVMLNDKDSIDVTSKYLYITKDGGGIKENIRRYNVVVGQFKQLFNAKSMRERLADDGYPGCFVAESTEPYYYVIVRGYDSINEAADMLRKVEKDKKFNFKKPLPFIITR